MLERVKKVAETAGPKGTFHQVSEENGGYLQANSASDLPRNRGQAKHCRSKSSSKNVDSLAILLQECKRQQLSLGQDPFIRDVTAAPELRCVLAFDWQLKKSKNFVPMHRNFQYFHQILRST